MDALAFASDGRHFVSAASDKTIRVWDVGSGRLERRLSVDRVEQNALAVSPDGRQVAAAERPGPVHLWDVGTGREVRRFEIRGGYAYAPAFSPDGRRLACMSHFTGPGGWRSEVQVWDTTTGREWRTLAIAGQTMSCPTFSPDGRMLATSSADGNLHLWELASGRERCTLVGHEGETFTICFSSGGRRLAVASTDAPAYVWDVSGGPSSVQPLTEAELEQLWADLASDDARIGYVTMWKLATTPGEAVAFLGKHLRPALPVAEERLAQLVTDLDSNRFEPRQRAIRELELLGLLAAPALKKALDGAHSLDFRRRVEQLLEKVEADVITPKVTRAIRAVEALEYAGTPEAVQLLNALARGASDARLTREAKATSDRLGRRRAVAP
jgi:hypothetical protein